MMRHRALVYSCEKDHGKCERWQFSMPRPDGERLIDRRGGSYSAAVAAGVLQSYGLSLSRIATLELQGRSPRESRGLSCDF
jgi:hypothetical protein